MGSVADTKLNGAAKGAALLQLILLSADVSQGPCGVYAPARARLLAETEKAAGASCFWLGLFAGTEKACTGCP